jgi:molybdate transport system substrate-binding protein
MRLTLGTLVMLAVAWACRAEADEIKVFSAGAVKAVIVDVADAFKQRTGHTIAVSFGGLGVTRQKLASEPTDVVIMTDVAIDEAIRQGAVVAGTRTDLARTGVGVGVREGASKPDISTPEALKQTLLAAKSIVYLDPAQGATSGIHVASVLQRLGIADAVKSKSLLWPGGYAAEAVAKGEAEIVLHQISEILPVKGVTLVGPLPKELQKITIYSAGLASKSERADAARSFINYLASAPVKVKFAQAGMDYHE